MPWQESTVEAQRERFAALALTEGANLSALCRQFGVSRPTGRQWRERAREAVAAGEPPELADRSRRPRASPGRTPPAVEAAVVARRDAHPAWGGRKRVPVLEREGWETVPAPSTVTEILRRHGRLPDPARPRHALLRFEAAEPNLVWQGDFMGGRALRGGGRCHPLTLIDDHSRSCLLALACPDQTLGTVWAAWVAAFAAAGLPRRIRTDHGPPWGAAGAGGVTAREARLVHLGVRPGHGRPRHPQTRGTVERLHRTIRAEQPALPTARDLAEAQALLDAWRHVDHHVRPHQALGGAVPADRWHPSPRPFPGSLPALAPLPGEEVRTVWHPGRVSFRGQVVHVGGGLVGERVAVRPDGDPGRFAVWLGPLRLTSFVLFGERRRRRSGGGRGSAGWKGCPRSIHAMGEGAGG